MEKFYNKNKSSASKSILISVLKIFDDFCVQIYGNDTKKLLEDLRGDMGYALYKFFQIIILYVNYFLGRMRNQKN